MSADMMAFAVACLLIIHIGLVSHRHAARYRDNLCTDKLTCRPAWAVQS